MPFVSAIAAATLGAAITFAAAPAWATPANPAAGGKADPAGANGTVKIDGWEFGDRIANEPHVTCDFEVAFFDYDQGERANLVFRVQPPTGSDTVLLRRDNILASADAAAGGRPDPDERYRFTAADLGLAGYSPHPKQGYHIKLTVERTDGREAGKHKVFWLRPCGSQPPGGEQTGAGDASPDSSPVASAGAGGGKAAPAMVPRSNVSGLPVTGVAVGSLAAVGVILMTGGAALLAVRRRRPTFVA